MKNTVVATVGENMDALFVGLKEFPTERVVLIVPEDKQHIADKTKSDLERFKIQVQTKSIKGNIWEEMFRVLGEIKNQEQSDHSNNIIINVATGDEDTKCAAISAAFVNGFKAFSIRDNETMLLPVLKFSYYKILTDKKMEILKTIFKNEDCCASLEELSKKTKMSLPLISYHINGTLKSEGLKSLGLVDTTEKKGRMSIKLSTLGKLLIKGYVTP